jgi:hypothetical protein
MCHKCYDYAFVDENELQSAPETHCDDLTFAEHEQSALEALERGDQCALLYFMRFCFDQGRDVPAWAKERFSSAVERALDYEIKSWSEVFGAPLEKGGQLPPKQRSLRLGEVWKLVNERRRAGEPLNKDLYEAVGRELGIGGATVVEEMYGEVSKEFRDQREGYALMRTQRVGYPVKHNSAPGQTRTIKAKILDTFAPPHGRTRKPRKD